MDRIRRTSLTCPARERPRPTHGLSCGSACEICRATVVLGRRGGFVPKCYRELSNTSWLGEPCPLCIMIRNTEDLGRHAGLAARALTKEEVAAALCDAGHRAGYWSVPEFEVQGQDGVRRRIDVAWATRQSPDAKSIWRPVAAFEIEGHRVAPGSIRKNVDSLQAAAGRGASVTAMILFQVGPDGKPWGRASVATSLPRADKHLQLFKLERGCGDSIEVVLDERLHDKLSIWVESVASQLGAAADAPHRARS